jgi:serine/threonine-protein kinase
VSSTSQANAVGSLVIEEKITSTGSGDVLLARQPGLGRRVLVRTLRRESLSNPGLVERFRREARMAARVSHPNVQQVFDLFAWRGDHYLVLEHVEGESLRVWLDRLGAPPPQVGRWIALELARAVEALHAAGLVHADLRAESVRIGRWGELKLGNLEWARGASEVGIAAPPRSACTAPEIEAGSAPDARSDVFAMASAIAELLGGRGLARELGRARHPDPARRPDAAALRALLERDLGAISPAAARAQLAAWLLRRADEKTPGPQPRRHRSWISSAARAAAPAGVAAGLVAALLINRGDANRPTPEATGPARIEPPSVDAGAASEPAWLRFAVFPWGEVRIDGEAAFLTPRAAPVELSPGVHRIEIAHPSLGRELREVSLAAGEKQTLRHVFDRTPAP